MYLFARKACRDILCFSYDFLVKSKKNQNVVIQKICSSWDIEFQRGMLEFRDQFGEGFIYLRKEEKENYTKINPRGIFDVVSVESSIRSDVPRHGLVTDDEEKIIVEKLGPIFR